MMSISSFCRRASQLAKSGDYTQNPPVAGEDERNREWVSKNSLFVSNGRNLGDRKCPAIEEDRL